MIGVGHEMHLVVRRHVDLGRTRSMLGWPLCPPPPSLTTPRSTKRPALSHGPAKDRPLMPDLRFKPSPATRTQIPRPKRGEGQWALGYTEPLNKNEQSKKDDDPLNVRDRILTIYSRH